MTPASARRCLKLLARFKHCDERREAADNRARLVPGTITGDRHLDTADRWEAKAAKAWDQVQEILTAIANG